MSSNTFAHKFTRVDSLTRPDHRHLTDKDDCYFVGEYTADQGYKYSNTNNFILNFKKKINRRGFQDWRYKEKAIRQAAEIFRRGMDPKILDYWTFVPIPPSKAKGDPRHDDRLTRMLQMIRPESPPDIREIIVQIESTDSFHTSGKQRFPEEIEALYSIDKSLLEPKPSYIAVVDDILTTGAHFRAMRAVLSSRFPTTQVIGFFLARRVWAPNAEDLGDRL